MINIKLNGSAYEFNGSTISDLLRDADCQEDKIAVELNREIITREDFSKITLKVGDEIELVEFVGGG